MTIKVGFLGCGLMTKRRASALPGGIAAAGYDIDPRRVEALQQSIRDVRACHAPSELFEHCDVVLVSTPHAYLAEHALAAIEAGRHVLIEKPGACRPTELDPLIDAATRRGVKRLATARSVTVRPSWPAVVT